MYRNEDDLDLRNKIYSLKKQLSQTNGENHLLKVKIRKLQDEVNKKDKQMDLLIDPGNSAKFRKIIYEKSATFLINMKEKNDKLQKMLYEKDALIKRLQNGLQTAKLYSHNQKRFIPNPMCTCMMENELESMEISQKHRLEIPETHTGRETFGADRSDAIKQYSDSNNSQCWILDLDSKSSPLLNTTDFYLKSNSNKNDHNKEQYKSLSRDHLLSIIESLKNNRYSPQPPHQLLTASRKSSPESDLDRIELQCETPHEEIQQLHQQFLEMISEIGYLKTTIVQLQDHQEKTENVLKEKGDNIGRLARQIKDLKKPKSNNNNQKHQKNHQNRLTNDAFVAAVYSTSTSNLIKPSSTRKNGNNRNGKGSEKSVSINVKNKIKRNTTNISTQVEQIADDVKEMSSGFKSCQLRYVEKGQVSITKKTSTSQTSTCNDSSEKSV